MKKIPILVTIISAFLFFSVGFIQPATSILTETENNLIEEKLRKEETKVENYEKNKNLLDFIVKKSDGNPEPLGLKLFLEYMKLAVATAVGGAFVLLVGCIVLPLLPVGMFMIGASAVFAILGVVALFVPE